MGKSQEKKVLSEKINDEARKASVISFLSLNFGYAMGYVLGVLLGDGSISRQKRGGVVLRLGVNDREFSQKFMKCLSSVCPWGVKIRMFSYTYAREASIITTPDRVSERKAATQTTWTVTCCNQGVASFFETLKARFYSLESFDPEMRRGILDGLFDSEGFFVKEEYAAIKMTDHASIAWISRELSAMGIHHTIKKTPTGYISRLGIYAKPDVIKLCRMLSYSVPRREAIRSKLLEA
jgi:hypothetical protein